MTLRCQACKKPLVRFAVSNVGSDGVEYGFGPKCGAAFVIRKRRKNKPQVAPRGNFSGRDMHTRDWINEAAVAA